MLLTREQLQERLIALHKASLELVKDFSLDRLLERIAALACEQSDARYAALGVLDDDGKLVKFISVGMTDDEIKRIAHPPVGKGLIGELKGLLEALQSASLLLQVRLRQRQAIGQPGVPGIGQTGALEQADGFLRLGGLKDFLT